MRSVESSEVEEPSCRTGVRISDFAEIGQVEYLSESMIARNQPCSSSATISPRSPGNRNWNRSVTPAPVVIPKKLFQFDDESIILAR